jgi:hypothetical protein
VIGWLTNEPQILPCAGDRLVLLLLEQLRAGWIHVQHARRVALPDECFVALQAEPFCELQAGQMRDRAWDEADAVEVPIHREGLRQGDEREAHQQEARGERAASDRCLASVTQLEPPPQHQQDQQWGEHEIGRTHLDRGRTRRPREEHTAWLIDRSDRDQRSAPLQAPGSR